MQKSKRQLNVIQPNNKHNQKIVKGTTCFSVQAKHNLCCQRKTCDQWINYSDGNNCVIISASNGPHTLQKIGQIYDLTRMRICQIEKNIFDKIRKISR